MHCTLLGTVLYSALYMWAHHYFVTTESERLFPFERLNTYTLLPLYWFATNLIAWKDKTIKKLLKQEQLKGLTCFLRFAKETFSNHARKDWCYAICNEAWENVSSWYNVSNCHALGYIFDKVFGYNWQVIVLSPNVRKNAWSRDIYSLRETITQRVTILSHAIRGTR